MGAYPSIYLPQRTWTTYAPLCSYILKDMVTNTPPLTYHVTCHGSSSSSSSLQPWLSLGNRSFPSCPREAPLRFCHNRADSRDSLKMVMALGPSMILFGHGPPLVMEVEEDEMKAGLGAGVARAKMPLLNGNASTTSMVPPPPPAGQDSSTSSSGRGGGGA